MFRVLTYLSLLHFLASCGPPSYSSARELRAFLEQEASPYSFNALTPAFELKLTYQPTDLIVSNHLGNETYTSEERIQLQEEVKKKIYFKLSFQKNNQDLLSSIPTNQEEFGHLSHLLSFEMGQWVSLSSLAGEEFTLIDFHYSRMYGMKNSSDLLFVFDRPADLGKQKEIQFQLGDFLAQNSAVQLSLPTQAFLQEPALIFAQ